MKRIDPTQMQAFGDALEALGRDGTAIEVPGFSAKDRALLSYALLLTREPGAVEKKDVLALRDAGCDDGEILDANQVTAYFAYANRLADGLGVELEDHNGEV